jgi:hypothetical protein
MKMSLDDFRDAAGREAAPPAGLSLALRALWHDARGDWESAHSAVQQDEQDRECAWGHAYLHRKEGDLGNAGYWYARAGRSMPARGAALQDEWSEIARTLLAS